MELECDLSNINNEELLRKMWQQSEDVNRKKEIRSQLYKLRESRLRDLYQGDIMADNSAAGFGKDPLVTSHGDALADQSFQSLKSKEIRDSMSPTEMRFQSMTLNNPNTTGWNVQSAKEVSPDGKGFRAETVATTDGIESVNGGIAEFKGRNEQRSSAHHEGDDKNFVKKAMESSNSHLQENVVIGDENSGRTEVRTSSTKSSSSSQVIKSSTNVEYDNGHPVQQQPPHSQKYLLDTNRPNQQDFQQRQQVEQQRLREEQRLYEQQFQQQHQKNLNQQEQHATEQVSTKHQHQTKQQKNISENIQTQETHEQNKRYVDMDKASPEYQQHVQNLMQQPGEIISNTVEYPKPNVKMITTVKRLPDGTIVRNKRYETEELTPTAPPSTRSTSTPLNQTQPRHDSQKVPSRNYQPDSSPHARPHHDMVDSSSTSRYVQDTQTDDLETKFSSTKKSSSKFSTETTSETIQEFDEHHHPPSGPSSRPKPKTDDFSTHGFPSVRTDKLTQEYPTERPHTGYPSQSMPSKPNAVVVPRYTDDTDNISERRVQTKDGEVIILSSEKKHNYKTSTNSEHIVETEHVIHDDKPHQQIPQKTSQDFSMHGFPSVREPSRHHPSEKQMQPQEQDFPMDKLPPGTRIINNQRKPNGEEEVVIVSSQKSHTAKHSSNVERIIEHNIVTDDQTGNFPGIRPNRNNTDSPYNYTVMTPGGQPVSPNKPSNVKYSNQEYPAVRTPGHAIPEERESYYEQPEETSVKRPTQGYPSVNSTPSRPAAGLPSSYRQHPSSPKTTPSQDYSTQGFPSVRTPSKTKPTQGYPSQVDDARFNGTTEQPYASPTKKMPSRTSSPNRYKTSTTTARETTERVVRKEKEVDSAHLAFAASLRSSSPFDHTDYHPRHTPRSSVSSNRTFKRDMREGSHESAPSETSRISNTTITRNTPPRTVGGRTTVTRTVTTKTGPGSNDSLNAISPRATKSPSPGKISSVTTTTTRTTTSKDVPKVTDNQHKRITTTSNKIDTLFPINEPPLTASITKIKFSDNHKRPHKNTKYNQNNNNYKNNKDSKKNIAAKTNKLINNASAGVEEVIEAPCLKKHYYKLGPSDQITEPQKNTTTNAPSLKSPQSNEKSPTKKPSSQPAPSSKSSTTTTSSINSRKPPTSVMTDDYDDDNVNKPSPFSSPSSRSRTPQKTVPSQANDKPQGDDWQMPRQPDSDERRTVQRETTFDKPEYEPRKPNFEPHVEWVIVDDHDYDDSDNDDFVPEVVDAKLNLKQTTTKLITQEKQVPLPTQKKPKSTSVTRQLPAAPTKIQTKPNDKSQLKTRPFHDFKTPTQTKTNKPMTQAKTPQYTTSKTPSKILNNKTLTKGPSPVAPLKKPLTKSGTTSKTSQVLNEKTAQFIVTEKLKEHKTKPKTPEKQRKPKDIEKEKPLARREPERKPKESENLESQAKQPQITDDESFEDMCYEPQIPSISSDFQKPEEDDIFLTPQPDSPEFENPQNTLNNPNSPTPGAQKPQKLTSVRKPPSSPGFQKLQMTFDERSPHFGSPHVAHDDEPYQPFMERPKPQQLIEESSPYPKPMQINEQPYQQVPGLKRPQEREPYIDQPYNRKPEEKYQENIFISKIYRQKIDGKEIPENKTTADKPLVSLETNEKPDLEPLAKDDDQDYKIDSKKSVVTSQKTVAKHIQKFETNFVKNNQPKPQIGTRAPINEPLQPLRTLPQTPEKFNKSIPTTEEPSDEEYENTAEFVINTKEKCVISGKNIVTKERKVPDEPRTPSSKTPQRITSPTRNQKKPEGTFGRRPQSPEKRVSPNRAQPGQKEPKDISPSRAQKKPEEPFGRRPQSPEKQVLPNRVHPGQKEPARKRAEEPFSGRSQSPDKPSSTQKNPETPLNRRPQSPNKHVSPQRPQKVTNEDESFIASLKTTKVSKEIIVQESDDQHPTEYPKGQKPLLQKPNGEILLEISEFEKNSSQKQIIKEKQINKFEKPLQPGRKSPEKLTKLPTRESSPTKRQEVPEKRAPFVHKHISPTHSQNKPGPDNFEPSGATENKLKGPKSYPEYTSDTVEEDDTVIETRECTINLVQKQNIKEDKYLHFTDKTRSDSKFPVKATSPTRTQPIDFNKQPEAKPSEVVRERSPSPNKQTSPTRTQKKSEEVKRIETKFTIQKNNEEKYQYNKKPATTEKGDRSPTREPLSKRPISPKKTLSPTRKSQPIIEHEERFQTNLTFNKTVTEKSKKLEPNQQHPNQTKSKEIRPSEKLSVDNEEEISISYQEPKFPLHDIPQTCIPREPKTPANDNEFAQIKITRKLDQDDEHPDVYKPQMTPDYIAPYLSEPSDNENDKLLTETTHFVKKNLVEEFDRPNKPRRDDSPQHKLPEEPETTRSPNQTPHSERLTPAYEEVITTNRKTSKHIFTETADGKTKEFIGKPIEPLDKDEDKTYLKTMEFTFKTSPKMPQEDKKTVFHTSEFIRNTSQKLIETEQKSSVNENDQYFTDSEETPRQDYSPKRPNDEHPLNETKKPNAWSKVDKTKSVIADDKTLRKSLRKDDKPDNVEPLDTDEEQLTSETEDLLIETCKNSYVIKKHSVTEEEQIQPLPISDKPEQPYKPDEGREIGEEPTRPGQAENVEPKNKAPFTAPLEPWLPEEVNKNTTDLNKEFIKSERDRKEIPDGAFVSKTTEPSTTPTSPTFRKKGAGRSDTFEERCRQILGMENYGDTQGTFKKQPITDVKQEKSIVINDTKRNIENESENTTVFQVTIEDCDQDDEPLSISSVKKTIHKKTHTTEPVKEETNRPSEGKEPKNKPNFTSPIKELNTQDDYTNSEERYAKFPKEEKDSSPKPDYTNPEDVFEPQEDRNKGYERTIIIQKTSPREKSEPIDKQPKYMTEAQKDYKNGFEHIITETTTVIKKASKNKPANETEPESSEPEISESKEFEKKSKSTAEKITKKTSPLTTPRSSSPTKSTSSPRSLSPTKSSSSPRGLSPTKSSSSPRSVSPSKPTSSKDTPKRKQSKDLLEPKSNKKSPPQHLDEDTTTIKDRLRSSTRKQNSPAKLEQVDGSDSSPERSPTRYTERRRSSNISVTTEIIIDHTDADAPLKKEKSPTIVRNPPQDSVYKEIIDSTVLPEKLTRRMPVTERKESAPVHRVTSKEKDTKMSRSTSENLIKIKNTEPQIVTPAKTSEHRRPNKCFATKSINLSTTDRLFKSEDMENVIIDIQHAKSSREPSPDKIVPTPVPAHLDTGKPRYPDVVQEPEDEQPKRKPQIKNIPIFEEENNDYLGCHITEINHMERTKKSSFDSLDYEANILKNPVVEAPASLDYVSLDQPSEDESLLTVHDKVNKFQTITENVNKSKTENAETLYSPIKLGPSAPQKSPELVRTISRHISRHNEPDYNNEVNADFPLTSQNNDNEECCFVDKKKFTKEFKVSHHEKKTTETTLKTAEKYQQPEEYVNDRQNDDDDDDDNELIPHTATHTTIIEERRQKDILSRPSVFESRNKKQSTTPTMKTPLKCNKSPVKDSEKLRPDNKSRIKPASSAVNNKTTEETLATTTTTTEANATTSNNPKQLPQRKNSDIDYEFRGSNVQTGVKNIISTQTKVYNKNSNTSTSSDSKTNDLKKPTTTTNNMKPAQHMPVRLTPSQNTDEHDLSADDNEMIVTDEQETPAAAIGIESQVITDEALNKATTNKKIPLHKIQSSTEHSSTNSSAMATERPKKMEQKDRLVKLTDNKLLKSNTVTTTTSYQTYDEFSENADDIDETVLEPATKQTPSQSKTSKMSTISTTDSVAAKRSLFENNNGSPKRTPLTSPHSGRRPSYMDHTKSSLEHTRKDSLEINKTNYSRKPSQPDEEETNGSGRNSLVKFDVPHGKRNTTARAASITEDINVEEISDLEVLEKLLETVQSYEIRRRVRAQIRLIKKNQKNEAISNSITEVTTRTVKITKGENEEPDTVTPATRKAKPEEKSARPKTQIKETPSHASSCKKEYIFEEAYHPTTRRSPKPNCYTYEKEAEQKPRKSSRSNERHYSPEKPQETELVTVKERSFTSTSKQEFYNTEEQHKHEIRKETSPSRKSPSPLRKPYSANSSPERRYASPESHGSLKDNKERSRSPQEKPIKHSREATSRSPDNKTLRKSSASSEQQETVKNSTSKLQTKRTTSITKTKPDDKTPVWADRKNILKTPSSNANKKPSAAVLDSRASGYTKTVKSSTTSQKMTSNKSSSFMDDDCVTSSYGIGPTDENGLPLFGIRALKKKKPVVEPSETTEEVTGYVVEEKYYSNNKTKPTLERKEFIYSTNPEELQKLKEHVEVTSKATSLQNVDVKELREAALITKTTPALRSSPEDDFLDSTTKYVRRGSVKEMSEKFIQKEASTNVTDKTNNNYPKAGLILRTNSRKSSRDMENENDNFESFRATRVQHHTSSALLADSDDNQYDYEVEEVESRHSGRFITESESECDSVKTQREFKKVTSSASSSMATCSFLNSEGEEKVVTNVSDCLERMRNADNVVEEGDTAEDQEARALLNKFLGASIIMKGVESSLPATNRQSKLRTITTTSSNLNDDNDGDNNARHEVKTTRITKTITSGSSSAPVTYTTCDIEEIWDEEILKELLEQARTYEERRKIRSRLRELMADREETKKSLKGDEKQATTAAATTSIAAANPTSTGEEESSASEYEEIIEEVTDYSEAESEVDDKRNEKIVISEKSAEKVKTSEPVVTKTDQTSVTVTTKLTKTSAPSEDRTDQTEETKTITETETIEEELIVEENEDKTDSSGKGEFVKTTVHDKPHKTLQTTPTNSKKQKLSQENFTSTSKTTVTENNNSANMYASYNNSSLKNPKASSTASSSNQNPVVAAQTTGRADSTSISHRNNNNTNILNSNNNNSGSGSLGGNSIVVGSNASPRQVDRLGVPQKEDSGTESGEDLRLIAAGLRDQLQIKNDSNIIEDVTCALSRLENSLNEGKDISIDVEKRKALLALVARLRAGLTSPEKLAEIAAAMSELDGNEGFYGETSSPEADAHRSNRGRFGKRKNRVDRHTVGVSREELADARRYMEDMLLMSNISQSTTPDANTMPNNTPPQFYALEKNASTGAILGPPLAPVLQRPKQFATDEKPDTAYTNRLSASNGKRRPLSGEYSVSFENSEPDEPKASVSASKQGSPEDGSKSSRFTNKKHLMKRANTIDLAKTRKYNPEFDTDSDAEDKGTKQGLKRAVQVSVKKRVQNVVPPFEPKTENDRKFLAFINKQSDKPGLSWTTSRSVSNWTNKFGSIKNTFEGGLVGKPPQPPHHVISTTKPQQTSKLLSQSVSTNNQTANYISNQQIALRLQREAERQAEERKRKLEKEQLEYERRERDKLERQRQQRERQERERLEREYFERQRREQDQITAAQHAAILREQKQLASAQQTAHNNNVPQPIPINEFKHAPQSVFRPIENGEAPTKPIYKPIPQLARNTSNWQTANAVPAKSYTNTTLTPGQYGGNTRPDNSFITSPPPSSRSPIGLPWASKPTVDSSSFKSKAHRFEERSKYDNIHNTAPFIQRHNSLRSSNGHHVPDESRKRPSLPNTFDPYSITTPQMACPQSSLAYLPPPQNISFTYSSLKTRPTYKSVPCLPLAVGNNLNDNRRPRQDSLTNPHSVPLVLTSANPSYCPNTQFQQQQSSQPFLQRKFDLVSPCDSEAASPSLYTGLQTDGTDDDFDSDNNLLEYHAVSRVMRKPQCQTAVTVGRRTGHVSDDELYGKNSRAAKNLLSTMKNLGNTNSTTRPSAAQTKRSETVSSPRTCLSPDGRSYQAPLVEPLFPEINKFEANRKPLYSDESLRKTTGSTALQQAPQRTQMGMYKSMENLNTSTAKAQSNFTRPLKESNFKPYVSETQTSYVVTYPLDDLTDGEDYRHGNQKKMMPPNTLDLSRHRHTSENSTGSSTTTSMTYSHNLPSPNTSWTSNPIAQEDIPYKHSKQSVPASPAPTAYQTLNANSSVKHNYKTTEVEAVSQRNISNPLAHQQTLAGSVKKEPAAKTQAPRTSLETNAQNQMIKPTGYAETKADKIVTSRSAIQKTTYDTRTRCIEQPVINPKNSNISQEMLIRLDQQRERITNEARRKSLGNSLDYQIEKQARIEATQNSQAYKSSAPPDTPDIVKSSLPKDDSQPILKKFGPPQRHHYMPNSYQSPSSKMTSSSVVASTITHSVQAQGKNLQTSSNHQTVVKKSQQILRHTKPTVMETPATPQPEDDYIPRNIVYNNVHAFSSMSRRQEGESTNVDHHPAIRPSKLSKSDSWNQIMMLQSQQTPTNTFKYNNPSPTNELRRTKSGHTLQVPKMYEAAMTKTDITEKQKTVAAYFSGQKSPVQADTLLEQQQQQTTKRTVINRTKTSEKVSAASRKSLGSNQPIMPIGLQRSATMPHIANVNMLDESNVEDAFEQLIMEQKQKSTSSTTEKTETKEEDGAVVTTTTKVTTRTVTGSAAAAKPVTPFAKFKQLDKQNIQQSAKSPTTPTTTGGGSTASASSGKQPIFKFTDPALNAKAATVKEQLLQWCQSKTQEYENIEITNFSTSWNNGLAFCALIHHFLPDAFDYSQLTPKNRRKNFELAFTVADEKAGIAPLLDVEDMVVMQRPDWKCVFVYVQSIYRRFRNCQ